MKVLIVEDSERLRRLLQRGLVGAGFAVDVAGDGEAGLDLAMVYDYDVIVLDLMLPRLSGLEVLRRLRREHRDPHVLILSARDQVADRVEGLELGADDYLVKPFDFSELLARLQALVRRRYEQKSPILELGGIVLDTLRRDAYRQGAPLQLTAGEYALLEGLARNRGRVQTKSALLDRLYDGEAEVSDNMIEKLISTLRKKVDPPEGPSIISTRRGFGYLIE